MPTIFQISLLVTCGTSWHLHSLYLKNDLYVLHQLSGGGPRREVLETEVGRSNSRIQEMEDVLPKQNNGLGRQRLLGNYVLLRLKIQVAAEQLFCSEFKTG